MGRLDGKVALVTGGAKGLGEADCRLFAQEGAAVIVADIDPDAKKVAEDIGGTFMHLDVSDEDNWKQVVKDIKQKFGSLHVLVNNAGIVEAGHILNTSLSSWRRVNAVSSDGTFLGCQNCIPLMLESGGGSIINMASIASLQGEYVVTAYCAAKGAVEALTRAVAVWAAQEGHEIRCNSIHPAGIATPMVFSMPDKMASANMIRSDQRPARANKLGVPDDIAYMALYLASDESKFVNGAAMRVDNSMSVTAGSVPER
jgi:3(or 17)beta-hydroxysteroid dehydrogenase